MKVERIKYYLEEFKTFIADQNGYPYAYKWEALKNYQENWNTEKKELYEMYNMSLVSNESRSLWGGEYNSAKSAMLKMIDSNPEFMRSAFRDLFLDQNDLSLRYRRFFAHCDEAMRAIELQSSKKMPHHHSGFEMCAVYLTFQFPDRYTFFDFDCYFKTMSKLELIKMPESYDVVRFVKLSRALYNFIAKDQDLIQQVNAKLDPTIHATGPHMILVHDFYEFMSAST